MMKKLLVLDFETKDPYISLGLGGGWPYALNVPTSRFKVLGFSTAYIGPDLKTVSKARYMAVTPESVECLRDLIKDSDGIIAHNAKYELGCLRVLGWSQKEIDTLSVYDTKIMSTLYDNTLFSTSLEFVSKKYLPEVSQKAKNILIDFAISSGLFPHIKPTDEMSATQASKYLKSVHDWCYQNMDVIQNASFETMAGYACQDAVAEGELFLYYINNGITLEQAEYWSSFVKILTSIRAKGNVIDMNALNQAIAKTSPIVDRLRYELWDKLGGTMVIENLNSPVQLAKALANQGYKLPKTSSDKDSTNSKWLKSMKHDPLINLIIEYRHTNKLYKDFLIKIRDMMEYTCPEARAGAPYGKVYPELWVFGAAATGRFSCTNPNLQQIPAHGELGQLVRSIFVPENPGSTWYKLDWSNQEGRLQVHYSYLLKLPGAANVVEEFKQDPNTCLHTLAGSLMFGVSKQEVKDNKAKYRTPAKSINLGISYGMQSGSLAKELGLPTQWVTSRKGFHFEVAGEKAAQILEQYHRAMPYIQPLLDTAKDSLITQGFIKTLDGRKLRREQDGRDYTGISKVIQGSAGDLMYKALKLGYEAGININAIVHDEFDIEGGPKDAALMKQIMESTHKLHVPMIAEITEGKNWGDTVK